MATGGLPIGPSRGPGVEYASEVDVEFVRKAVRAIGRTAVKIEAATQKCIDVLLQLIKTRINYVVQEGIIVIKDIFRKYPNRVRPTPPDPVNAGRTRLGPGNPSPAASKGWMEAFFEFQGKYPPSSPPAEGQLDPSRVSALLLFPVAPPSHKRSLLPLLPAPQYESIIGALCENLDTLDEPDAKASMIWIIGEYAERIENADTHAPPPGHNPKLSDPKQVFLSWGSNGLVSSPRRPPGVGCQAQHVAGCHLSFDLGSPPGRLGFLGGSTWRVWGG